MKILKMNIGNFDINKRQIAIMIVLLIGLIVSVYLVLNRQIFKSRASLITKPFEVIQDTDPPQPAECSGNTCVTTTLNVIIKPVIDPDEPKQPIPAVVVAPKLSGGAAILDPGHDIDRNLDGEGKLREGSLNLKIAQRTRDFLQAEGVAAYLTHEGNLGGEKRGNKYDDDLRKRVARINELADNGGRIFIDIHFDSSAPGINEGPRAYYNSQREFAQDSRRLAELVSGAISQRTGSSRGTDVAEDIRDIPPAGSPVYILGPQGVRSNPDKPESEITVATKIPGILLEYFISNGPAGDLTRAYLDRAGDDNFVNAVAKGYCDGALQYLAGRNCR